jgi:hypothetical protein
MPMTDARIESFLADVLALEGLPRPLPRSDRRGNATAKGNDDRRALEVRSERY